MRSHADAAANIAPPMKTKNVVSTNVIFKHVPIYVNKILEIFLFVSLIMSYFESF